MQPPDQAAGNAARTNMAKKTVKFNQEGIGKLPDDKPVVYRILTDGGRNNYTGIAKRGRVQGRLVEHLPGGRDPIPGTRVQIEQMPSIEASRSREARIIARSQPRYNKQGK
jgi:hypothetical protein